MEKNFVLYSGGLDSRLVSKILKEKKSIELIFLKLPFSKYFKTSEKDDFIEREELKIHVIDVCKGGLFKEYLELLKNPKFGRGKGFNPCIDCKIWMFKKAYDFAKKLSGNCKVNIFSGEVPGQRPMSQSIYSKEKIDSNLNFKVHRLLEEMGLKGKIRKKQIELAEKLKISYPNPSGGCLLCEVNLKKRFNALIENYFLNQNNYSLSKIGRHFFIGGVWFVVARDKKEGNIISEIKHGKFLNGFEGAPAVYFSKDNGLARKKAKELQEAYSKNKKDFKKFQNFKI